MPESPAVPIAAAPGRLTRQDLLRLGAAGRAREFLPLAARALEQQADDHDLRILFAANCAQLGLKTLAEHTLDALPDVARQSPNAQSLRDAVGSMPEHEVSASDRSATARANLDVISERHPDAGDVLEAAWPAWTTSRDCARWLKTSDDQLLRWIPGEPTASWTARLIDHRALADRFCRERLGPSVTFPPPIAIEGLDPPWLFEALWRATRPNLVGYAAPVTLVQADPAEFLDGLAFADLQEALRDPRVRLFVGPEAGEAWLRDAMERLDEQSFGMTVSTPGVRTKTTPDAQSITNRWSAAQSDALRRAQLGVARTYGDRDAAWWAKRFASARAGGAPLRVLIPSSRYSTYVRHASEDLAASFRQLGCEARVAIEAGEHSRPTPLGQLRWASGFEPDLIVLINYFREDAGLPFPAQIPWVTWIQDAMPHQFRERRYGELDFVAGHLHRELRDADGFPMERALPFPVVASERKFHGGPVEPELARRLECEVAYVSHQSETPGAFHARCAAEETDPTMRRLFEDLRPSVEREAAAPMGESLHRRLHAYAMSVASRSASDDPRRAHSLFRQYALPLADRILRHEMLRWASAICERHGWRLKIFGRGWHEHPEFARHAAGELEHGEALRTSYRVAAVHLHASVNTLVHQRVMECALSGGLPVGRMTSDIADSVLGVAKRDAVTAREPDRIDADTGMHWYRVCDCPSLTRASAIREWLGLESPDLQGISRAQVESYSRSDHAAAAGADAAWLFDSLPELTVRSEAELEPLLARAIGDRPWRDAHSASIAGRVRDRCSTAVFAGRVLEMVTRSLQSESRPERCDTGRVPAA